MGLFVLGCASGPSFRQIEKKIPTLAAGQGRIFFVQSAEYSGSGGGHEVRLNGFYIGTSVPGGFFYADRDAGKYVVHCSSDTLKFTLEAGGTKYIELVPTLYGDNPTGVRIVPIHNAEGETMLKKLFYSGGAFYKANF
jgi:hypothetical protein